MKQHLVLLAALGLAVFAAVPEAEAIPAAVQRAAPANDSVITYVAARRRAAAGRTSVATGRRGTVARRSTVASGPRGTVARRTTVVNPRGPGAAVRRTTVVRPGVSGARWVRPGRYYWRPGGAIAAGAAIGFVTAASAVAWAGAAPAPDMCWYYTDVDRTQGFWDACP